MSPLKTQAKTLVWTEPKRQVGEGGRLFLLIMLTAGAISGAHTHDTTPAAFLIKIHNPRMTRLDSHGGGEAYRILEKN